MIAYTISNVVENNNKGLSKVDFPREDDLYTEVDDGNKYLR